MRKYTINGDFFDCQLHRDYLYIWDMDGMLSLYDWVGIKCRLQELLHATGIHKNIKAFENLRQGLPVEVVGGMFPTDTAFIGKYLYTAVESGLYRGSAVIDTYKKSRFVTSSKPSMVWDCPPLSLTANYSGMQLAISTGEEGLYEINLSRDTETRGLRRITGDIFEVSKKNTIRSRYVKYSNIYSTDENLTKSLHAFIISKNNNGGMVRTYNQDYDFGSILHQGMWESIHGTESFSCISRITPKGVEVYPLYKKQKRISQKPRMEMEGTKRKLIAVEPISFGKIIEYENGLQLRMKNGQELIRINTPVTRWRWIHKNGRSCLIVVLDDCLEIYEF